MNAIAGSRNLVIDQGKSIAMLCVLVLHASMAYVPGYVWVVSDAESSLFFAAIARVFDIFPMPTFFYFAGIFFAKSIQKRDFLDYTARRASRLLLPFTFGLVILNPITQYMRVMDYGRSESFLQFFFHGYFREGMTSYHLWFLLVLFVFQVALYYPVKRQWLERLRNTFVLIALGLLAMTLTARLFGDNEWLTFIQVGVIRIQPARCVAYLTFFILGVFGAIKSAGSRKELAATITAFSLLVTVELLFSLFFYKVIDTSIFLSFVDSLLYFGLSYCFIAMWMIFLSRRAIPFLVNLAQYSYGVYVVHFSISVIFQYILKSVGISIYLKVPIVLFASFAISLLIVMLTQKLLGRLRASGDKAHSPLRTS